MLACRLCVLYSALLRLVAGNTNHRITLLTSNHCRIRLERSESMTVAALPYPRASSHCLISRTHVIQKYAVVIHFQCITTRKRNVCINPLKSRVVKCIHVCMVIYILVCVCVCVCLCVRECLHGYIMCECVCVCV